MIVGLGVRRMSWRDCGGGGEELEGSGVEFLGAVF